MHMFMGSLYVFFQYNTQRLFDHCYIYNISEMLLDDHNWCLPPNIPFGHQQQRELSSLDIQSLCESSIIFFLAISVIRVQAQSAGRKMKLLATSLVWSQFVSAVCCAVFREFLEFICSHFLDQWSHSHWTLMSWKSKQFWVCFTEPLALPILCSSSSSSLCNTQVLPSQGEKKLSLPLSSFPLSGRCSVWQPSWRISNVVFLTFPLEFLCFCTLGLFYSPVLSFNKYPLWLTLPRSHLPADADAEELLESSSLL